MSIISDSAYSNKGRAFNVYCIECEDLIMSPAKGHYKHIFQSNQGLRIANKPGGKCKCGQDYDLDDSKTFLLATKASSKIDKAEKAGQDAKNKILGEEANADSVIKDSKKEVKSSKSKVAGL